MRTQVSPTAKGYEMLMAMPWSNINGRPPKNDFTIFFKLHNNDNTGTVIHENMSGGNPDRPLTWMRCTLSSEDATSIRPLRESATPQPSSAVSMYRLNGMRLSDARGMKSHEIYISQGKKVMKRK